MAKPVIIVESPTKAKSITKYLASKYTVLASRGHVRDLPKNSLGVDIEKDFEPQYRVLSDKKEVIAAIRKAVKSAQAVYLAPDPDREGEAIAWHIYELIKDDNPNVSRVLFNEITSRGVAAGLANPRPLDRALFDAQQARRVLDRLVGYELSPLLWKKVRRGLSAGRVQSVAVRLVVEREREIRAFVPQEYWNLWVILQTAARERFTARLWRVDGKKAHVPDAAAADAIFAEFDGPYRVASVTRKEQRKYPAPPFITSTLQQEASRRFHFPAQKTMSLAQQLYEGVELGSAGELVGLITYMRTDSTRVSEDALREVREFIGNRYGAPYLPHKANQYKVKSNAQDAHEAIRPTDVTRTPEQVEQMLAASRSNRADARNLARLYELVWKRFVASQMAAAVYDATVAEIERGRLTLRAAGSIQKFAGFTVLYEENREKEGSEAAEEDEGSAQLPEMAEGDRPDLVTKHKEQKFTQPPPRFSEATLIRELEEKGIGRPSTYATIMTTIVNRKYVERVSGRFAPTELGEIVTDLLVAAFPDIVDVEFTARMEKNLDGVEENKVAWRQLVREFYDRFHPVVLSAEKGLPNIRSRVEPTDIVCDKCGAPMVVRWGSNGSFLACSGYPACKNTREFRRDAEGRIEVIEPERRSETCPSCGAPMVVRQSKFGAFLGCSRYPECKGTLPLLLPFACPRPGCTGHLVEKRGKKGKVFYGCSRYNADPPCDFVTWDKPVAETCPQCGHAYLFLHAPLRRGGRKSLTCPKCEYKRNVEG